jgi:hypothetical protein
MFVRVEWGWGVFSVGAVVWMYYGVVFWPVWRPALPELPVLADCVGSGALCSRWVDIRFVVDLVIDPPGPPGGFAGV